MSSPPTPTGTQSPKQYATFPRRLNALSTDALILIGFSAVMLALLPNGRERPALRLSLGFLWLAALILYEPIMVTWFGGTLGHRLMNLKVVDDHTGGNPGLIKSILRYLIKGILGVISFFSMSFARRHQALHDMLTRSTVQIRDPGKAAPHHYVVGRNPPPPP
jgi:uncharacterized RDD family membrane protein YckC